MTIFSKNFGGPMAPLAPLATPMTILQIHMLRVRFSQRFLSTTSLPALFLLQFFALHSLNEF